MTKMRKILTAVLTCACVAALATALVACGGQSSSEKSESNSNAEKSEPSYKTTADGKYASGTHHAKVKVKGFDAFTIELDADSAPVTVSNFCELVESGFYDGLPFHRIVEDFCLQGGDPTGTGGGGSDQEILGEFSQNGVDNKLADNFEKGVVAMARTQLPNSASSQFFVTLDSGDEIEASLNGRYAAFGTIDKDGMKVVDEIVEKYLPKVTDQASGTIADKADMPTIEKIELTD